MLTKETHEINGHVGGYKTYCILREHFFWGNMCKSVKKIIRSCELCQKTKIFNQNTKGPMISHNPNKLFETISLDLMGPLPKGQGGIQYILVLIDTFSKFCKIYAIKKATTSVILKRILKDYIPSVGAIQNILTDRGTQFTNKKWNQKLKN